MTKEEFEIGIAVLVESSCASGKYFELFWPQLPDSDLWVGRGSRGWRVWIHAEMPLDLSSSREVGELLWQRGFRTLPDAVEERT